MKNVLVAASLLIISSLACAAKPVESHCADSEKIIFSCTAGKKIISVCSAGIGMQYRFGRKGAAELSWPESAAQKNLVTSGNIMLSGGGGAYLRFTKGQISYVVYSAVTRGGDKEGVAVEQGDKMIAHVSCTQAATSELGGDLTKNIPEDQKIFTLP